MDKVTYMAVNDITEEEYNAIEVSMLIEQVAVSPMVVAIMEELIDRAPSAGRRNRVGAARSVPLAYTH